MNNISMNVNPDELHRGVKMAMDSGEASSVDEAYALFSKYNLTVRVGPEVRSSRAHQAALLSVVNAGRRSLLGGVHVVGALDTKLLVPSIFGGNTLSEAIVATGGSCGESATSNAPVLLLGSVANTANAAIALRLTFSAWSGGVAPAEDNLVLAEKPSDVLGAILAAGIALSEIFQWLRGNGRAAHRACGLSLWAPGADWTHVVDAPPLSIAPSDVWVLGLGHLGQAFLWALTLITSDVSAPLNVTLHDFDRLTIANDSTSLLTTKAMKGKFKTRAVGELLERLGMKSSIVERAFNGHEHVNGKDPRILFCGVDNGSTRALIDGPGFDLIVESGLGNGLQEYLAMRIHSFPGSRKAAAIWSEEEGKEAALNADAYKDLESRGMDRCGLLQLASRSVGVPFVGLVAATLSLGEIIRTLLGGQRHDVLDLSLRDPALLEAVTLTRNDIGNLGFVTIGNDD